MEADERERETNEPYFVEAETDEEDDDNDFNIEEVSMVIYVLHLNIDCNFSYSINT